MFHTIMSAILYTRWPYVDMIIEITLYVMEMDTGVDYQYPKSG